MNKLFNLIKKYIFAGTLRFVKMHLQGELLTFEVSAMTSYYLNISHI